MAKRTLGWLAVTSGILVGLYCLWMSNITWISDGDDWVRWYQTRAECLGWGILGVVALAGSVVACRHPRAAALAFITSAPIAAVCLAYPQTSMSETLPGGHVSCCLVPIPEFAFLLGLFYFLPFLTALVAACNRVAAAYYFLISATLAGIVFALSGWAAVVLPLLLAWSAFLVALGTFWSVVAYFDWPPLVEARPQTRLRRLSAVLGGCLLVLAVQATASCIYSVAHSALQASMGPEIFVQPERPDHVVLIVQVIAAGGGTAGPADFRGGWAIAVVRERFWGMPRWAPPIVFLTNVAAPYPGQTLFVSGYRPRPFLARFLPIVELGRVSGPLALKRIQVRLLRKPPPPGETHIFGFVSKPPPPSWAGHWLVVGRPYPGAIVRIAGPSGSAVAMTDQEGIYEFTGLPPDDYTVKVIDLPDTQIAREHKLKKIFFQSSSLHQFDFPVESNTSLAGACLDI